MGKMQSVDVQTLQNVSVQTILLNLQGTFIAVEIFKSPLSFPDKIASLTPLFPLSREAGGQEQALRGESCDSLSGPVRTPDPPPGGRRLVPTGCAPRPEPERRTKSSKREVPGAWNREPSFRLSAQLQWPGTPNHSSLKYG